MNTSSIRTAAAAAAMLLVAAGCQMESDDGFGPEPVTPIPNEPVTAVTVQGNLEVTIATDRTRYLDTDPVHMMFAVHNLGHTPITFQFVTSQTHDFAAEAHGGLVWNASYGQAYLQAFRSMTLEPGATWTRTATWHQQDNAQRPVARGAYTIRAVLLNAERGSGPIHSAPIAITLQQNANHHP